MKICLICNEIQTFCECDKPIYDKDELLLKYAAELQKEIIRNKPIRVPTDEEIEDQAHIYSRGNGLSQFNGYYDGAKWMREQILNETK